MDLKINIHSFIDIITNSSSELYVTATNKTLSVEVKESSKELEQVANVLNKLRSLFNINASYN